MTLNQIINRVRSIARDFNGSIYREQDIIDFAQEGIDRLRSIPELVNMPYPATKSTEITFLPTQYHPLIAMYSVSRCFFLDGQSYNSGTMMNEFENKMSELIGKIADGEVVIKDADGLIVTPDYVSDAVNDVYFIPSDTSNDTDNLDNYIKFWQ